MDYFDFSKNDGRVFIPKARSVKKSSTFDKFFESKIHSSSLDNFARYDEEREKIRRNSKNEKDLEAD